jgi:hypothetical protein
MTPADLILGSTNFSRWGDGEWSAILGKGTENCDGQAYEEDLANGLAAVLRDSPDYLLGMQGLARRRFGAEIDEWLRGIHGLEWIDAGIFHKASHYGRHGAISDAMARRQVVLVGPMRLSGIEARFPVVRHVVIPDRSCWDSYASWADQACEIVSNYAAPLVAISAGMPGNLLVHRMSKECPHATAIDFGSLWEPYVGHANRSYHQGVIERLRAC